MTKKSKKKKPEPNGIQPELNKMKGKIAKPDLGLELDRLKILV